MRAVNLLTPERAPRRRAPAPRAPSAMEHPGGLGRSSLLGALALCVAGRRRRRSSPATWSRSARPTLAQVSAKSDATVKRAAELKPYADFQTLAQERVATVQALAGAALRLGAGRCATSRAPCPPTST